MSDRERQDDAVERLYRSGSGEAPPAALDRRILDAAAAAAAPLRDRHNLGRRRLRAGAGFATAAVMVLAVALLLRQEPEPPLSSADRATPVGAIPEEAVRREKREDAAETAARQQRLERLMADEKSRSRGFSLGAAPAAERPAAAAPAPQASSADAAAPAAAADMADPLGGVQLRVEGCAEPYPVPGGAQIRPRPDGLAVTVNGRTDVLRCEAGVWRRSPAAPDQGQSDDPNDARSNAQSNR